eukprot:Em0005g438a
MPSRNRKKRSKQQAEYLQKQDDFLSQENKAKAQARYKADPEKEASQIPGSGAGDSYEADPEKKKASVRYSRDNIIFGYSYNADVESKQSAKRQRYQEDLEENRAAKRQRYQEDVEENRAAKRQRYQEDLKENRAAKRQRYQEDVEENRAAKRQKYEDNSAAIKASERNRYWNDPAVRLAKRAAERKRYCRGHRTTTTTQRCSAAPLLSAISSSSSAAPTATSSRAAPISSSSSSRAAPTATISSRSTATCTSPTIGTSIGTSAPTTTLTAATLAAATTTCMAPMAGTRPPRSEGERKRTRQGNPQPNNIALGVGIGVGVGVPVVLAVILVTVGVVYCTSKGERLEYNNIIMLSPLLCFIVYTPLNPDLQVETQASSLTLPCQLTGGTSCPTMICPNTAVNYTCNVGSFAGNTVWNAPSVGVCSGTTLTLTQAPLAQGQSCLSGQSSSGTCGPFTVTNTPPLTSNVYCLTSTLSVVVTSAMNGLVVSCSSYSQASATTTPVGNATISVVDCYKIVTNLLQSVMICTIAAPPSAPTITSLISTYSDQLTVTWTSVPTATSYNVSINASVNTIYNVSSTGAPSYMKNFNGLTNNTVYTVSVVAINCAGSSSTLQTINNMGFEPAGPSTTVAASSATPMSSISISIYSTQCFFGPNSTCSKIRNEGASPDAGSPDHKGPSKPPRAKQTSPSRGEAPKPAAKPKEALVYADVGSVSTKSNGNKSAQPPANKKYDDGVAYSDVKH